MSTSGPSPWTEFSHDPRRPETHGLRASDRDRDVVLRVLAEAFADGRLDRTEYDERADAATRARTMGELPPVIADLVPASPSATGSELATASSEDLRALAVRRYERSRRNAASSVLVTALIMTAIWALGGAGYYWPAWVIVFPAINLLRLVLTRRDHIEDQLRSLEKKQRRELERGQDTGGAE